MSARDFPGLDEAATRAAKAIGVLESAIAHATPRDGEALPDVAVRLRGAAVLAHSAGLELAMVSGIHSAANDASEAGLLDWSDDDG